METIRYSAYGEEQIFNAAGQVATTSLTPWRFSSKRVDPESGWVFFGRRYYDPEVGRWTTPDPLRFEDGPNLYCYVENRPLRFVDPRGLSSVDAFKHCFMGAPITVNGFDRAADRMNQSLASLGGIVQFRESRETETDCNTYGKKSSKIAITFINGICNSIDDARASTQRISNMAGGCEVKGVYNQTHGTHLDLFECALGFANIHTDPVQKLHALWDKCFEELDDDGKILHACHSQGALHTKNALATYDEEKRKRIQVLAVAPAAYIGKDVCLMIEHFRSIRDIVPLIHLKGLLSNLDTTTILSAHPDAPLLDHEFSSPTYDDHLKESINDALESQGVYF